MAIEKDRVELEQLFCKWLSMYRMIPMLRMLSLGTKYVDPLSRAAWLELRDVIDNSNLFEGDDPEVLKKMVKENKNWIKYAMQDFEYYTYVFRGLLEGVNTEEYDKFKELQEEREEVYLLRMQEQFDLLEWEPKCFELQQKYTCIMDIGCGTLPYINLFAESNSKNILTYYGVDKREIPPGPYMLGKSGMAAEIICCDLTQESERALLGEYKPTVLFFGESLHCFVKPLELLLQLVELLPTVQEILVLEFSDESWLGVGMDFHMRMHGGFGKIDLEYIKLFAGKLNAEVEVQRPSSQHNLYRIMLK